MKAAVLHTFDGPAGVRIDDMPLPEPGPGEVRLRVGASAMNSSDLQMTNGGYGRPNLPLILGQEASGTVDAVGPGVSAKVGDRLAGHVRQCWAEYAVAKVEELVPVPDGVSDEVAASAVIAYLTAGMALVDLARVQAGEWVLVNPGTGGVGTAAIQLAKMLGANVIATSSKDEKLAELTSLGADHVLNYTTADVPKEVQAISGGGVQVALDGAGKITFAQCLEGIRNNGRIAIYGYVTGMDAALPIGRVLNKNAAVYGFAIWSNAAYPNTVRWLGEVALPAFAAGKLKPTIDGTVDLAGVPDGLSRVRDRQVNGKLVISTK